MATVRPRTPYNGLGWPWWEGGLARDWGIAVQHCLYIIMANVVVFPQSLSGAKTVGKCTFLAFPHSLPPLKIVGNCIRKNILALFPRLNLWGNALLEASRPGKLHLIWK